MGKELQLQGSKMQLSDLDGRQDGSWNLRASTPSGSGTVIVASMAEGQQTPHSLLQSVSATRTASQ